MARSIQQIQTSILNNIANNPVLSTQLTSQSQVALYNLWVYIMSVALNQEENINDMFINNNEVYLSSNPPATPQWVLKYVYAFQYSSSNPQTIQLNTTNLIPTYTSINTNYQIITQASIVTPYVNSNGITIGTPGVVLIKVATGNPSQPLNSLQLSAFQTYLNIIKPAGIVYQAFSVAADLLMVNVTIYYSGSYAAIIQSNVYNTYINFISNTPFNGVIQISDLEVAIRQTAGVTDMEFNNINYRAYSSPFVSGSYNIINNNTQLLKDTSTLVFSGLIQDETTTGYDFMTLNANNYIAQ